MIKKLSIALLLNLPILLLAQSVTQKVNKQFQLFSKSESLKHASFSLTVLDAKNGATVFSSNTNLGLAPASTLKLISSATAIQLLGGDYTFKTTVTYTGTIVNETLNGDLLINGHGDPTLGSNRWPNTNKNSILNLILQAIIKAGIKNINGKIIANDSYWDTQSLPDGWLWQDIGNYYGAQTSALCWDENQLKLALVSGKNKGFKVSLKEKIAYPFLNLVNEVKTGDINTGDNVYAYSAPYTNIIYLRGYYGINCKKEIGISLPDPALAMAYDLQAFLLKNNIPVNEITTARLVGSAFQNPAKAVTIATIISPKLSEIIYPLNQKSVNLFAEQLLRTLAIEKGKDATFNTGINVIKKYWYNMGIDSTELNIYDGSGLSPANKVSTTAMANILYKAQNFTGFTQFYTSIPTHNNIVMKSGQISNVLAYAGYQSNGEGKYCFSIMINNYSGSRIAMRQKLFSLLDVLK